MWSALNQLPALLTELLQLLHEQNSLLRELIAAQNGQRATTPLPQPVLRDKWHLPNQRPSPARQIRRAEAADVFQAGHLAPDHPTSDPFASPPSETLSEPKI